MTSSENTDWGLSAPKVDLVLDGVDTLSIVSESLVSVTSRLALIIESYKSRYSHQKLTLKPPSAEWPEGHSVVVICSASRPAHRRTVRTENQFVMYRASVRNRLTAGANEPVTGISGSFPDTFLKIWPTVREVVVASELIIELDAACTIHLRRKRTSEVLSRGRGRV